MSSLGSVCVIGGGLVGVLGGYRLAQQKLDVTLVEMHEIGAAASSAAAGLLAPFAEHEQDSPLFRAAADARQRYFAVCEELEAATQLKIGRARSGLGFVALDVVQARKLKARVEWLRAAGFAAEWRDDAQSVHKEIAPEMAGAAVFPDEAWIAPRELMAAAGRAARLADVKIIEHRRAVRVQAGPSGFEVQLEDGTAKVFDRVVIAGGAWSSRLPIVDKNGADLRASVGIEETSVEPVRGVLLHADWAPHTLDTIIMLRGGYVVPRGGSSVIIGTSSEDAGFDATVTIDAIASIEARVHRVVPSLGNARIVDRWAGLRPYARRERPIIAETKIPGLFYATGHYRNGILLAPLTAEVVAALVSGTAHPHAAAFR